jgi:hypothetical protein
MLILFLVILLAASSVRAQTAIELIEAGRISEARQRVEGVDSLSRYRDFLTAMTEKDAVRACSLYQIVSWRYPETDVDRLAQERLLAYQAWGQSLPPFIAPGLTLKPVTPDTSTQVPAKQETVAVAPVPSPQEMAKTESSQTIVVSRPPPEPEVVSTPKIEKQEPDTSTGAIITETEEQTIVQTPEPPKEPIKPSAPQRTVQPISEPPKTPHDVETPSNGRYWVQVGAFGVRENADKLAEKLRGAGYSVTIVSQQSTKTLLHHVRVGGYPTRAAAQAAGEKLKENLGLEFRIVEM